MLDFNLRTMLFTIKPEHHKVEQLKEILSKHPEVQFVSFVGIDIGGHDTDEKIPIKAFMDDMAKMLRDGVQTDGSSVVLPKIADLNNAKVDIIPDLDVNWYVDYNFDHIVDDMPVGTLRIPSFLKHNDTFEVGSRVVLRDAMKVFKEEMMKSLEAHPYVFEYMDIDSVDDIDHLVITSATELEFWVKTPDEQSDKEQLSAAQEMKTQYWKRTQGPVRTALEKCLTILDHYGFEMEMGHKEVGGVKAKLSHTGRYDHVLEQLEIDWKYADAMQAADNENMIKYVVRDVFRAYGLDVTFLAKPIEGVAGNGEHTHIGLAAKLKNGKMASMFASKGNEDYLNPIGYGALMGMLKNYEVINPFVSSSNDAFNRLKPGFEAPVCTVTSMGKAVDLPSRNRTVLLGLIREMNNPLSTRFELRAPNPKSNTYLVLAASYMAIIDGVRAVTEAGKTPKELEKSISKKAGEEDFYLETEREYRSELDVFEHFTPEERAHLFGNPPQTVWENIKAFDLYPEKTAIFKEGDVMVDITLESYKEAILNQWVLEIHNRIVPDVMDEVRKCKKSHKDDEANDYDHLMWSRVEKLKNEIGRNSIDEKCLLTRLLDALDSGDYDEASKLQIEAQKAVEQLTDTYLTYKKNLI